MSETSHIRILVIDDDPIVQKVFSQFLVGQGYNVQQAENGKVAMRMMDEQRPDLIITDILMPEMDGLEILMSIRKTHDNMPIIAISGGMRSLPINFLEQAKLFGARHVLEKPVPLDVLKKTVESTLAEAYD